MQALIYGLSMTEIERHYRLNNFPMKRFLWDTEHPVQMASIVEVKTNSFSVGGEAR